MLEIFEGVKFGDKFRLRNGHCAVFIRANHYCKGLAMFFTYDSHVPLYVFLTDGKQDQRDDGFDVVAKWDKGETEIASSAEKGLFKGARFGDKFRTVMGCRALYIKDEGAFCVLYVKDKGLVYYDKETESNVHKAYKESDIYDIVARWSDDWVNVADEAVCVARCGFNYKRICKGEYCIFYGK